MRKDWHNFTQPETILWCQHDPTCIQFLILPGDFWRLAHQNQPTLKQLPEFQAPPWPRDKVGRRARRPWRLPPWPLLRSGKSSPFAPGSCCCAKDPSSSSSPSLKHLEATWSMAIDEYLRHLGLQFEEDADLAWLGSTVVHLKLFHKALKPSPWSQGTVIKSLGAIGFMARWLGGIGRLCFKQIFTILGPFLRSSSILIIFPEVRCALPAPAPVGNPKRSENDPSSTFKGSSQHDLPKKKHNLSLPLSWLMRNHIFFLAEIIFNGGLEISFFLECVLLIRQQGESTFFTLPLEIIKKKHRLWCLV